MQVAVISVAALNKTVADKSFTLSFADFLLTGSGGTAKVYQQARGLASKTGKFQKKKKTIAKLLQQFGLLIN